MKTILNYNNINNYTFMGTITANFQVNILKGENFDEVEKCVTKCDELPEANKAYLDAYVKVGEAKELLMYNYDTNKYDVLFSTVGIAKQLKSLEQKINK